MDQHTVDCLVGVLLTLWSNNTFTIIIFLFDFECLEFKDIYRKSKYSVTADLSDLTEQGKKKTQKEILMQAAEELVSIQGKNS